MSIRKLLLLGALLALILPAQASAGGNPPGWQKKLDNALQHETKKNNRVQRIIVRAAPGHEADVKGLIKGKGKIKAEHPFIHAFSALVNSKDFQALAGSPWVLSMSVDARMSGLQDPSTDATTVAGIDDTLRATLGLNAMSPTGANVGVAVIDSGIAPSPEFDGRISAFYDFTQGGIPTDPYDDYGHGTHVAGLIGGNGSLSAGQYQGVAPGARLIGLKVLNAQGAGYASDIISALEFAIAHKADLGIDVINMSLGHPIFESTATDPLVAAVDAATANGIVVVVSAGNIGRNPTTGIVGYGGITSPANALTAITVGAADTHGSVSRWDDTIPDYSSRGPSWLDGFAKPDLVAPGHRMISATTTECTLYQQYPQIRETVSTGSELLRLSGTSMSAGVASGAVAVLIDAHRQARPEAAQLNAKQVKAILEFTAIQIPGAHLLAQGTGELNVAGAMALDAALDFSMTGGGLQFAVQTTTDIGGELLPWTEEIIWAKNVVWGENAVFSDNVVWGESDVDSDNIVWGDCDIENIVWGESDIENIVWGESDLENIVWGESDLENIVWGENVVWGESLLDIENIVWGETVGAQSDIDADNIVWGETILSLDGVL